MKSRLTAALIGVALTLTGLLVLEGVSRALLTAQADLAPEQPDWYRYTPDLGWERRPHFKGLVAGEVHRHEPARYLREFDAQGFFAVDTAQIGDTTRKRILAIGDSNTFGWGVPTRNAYPEVLDDLPGGSWTPNPAFAGCAQRCDTSPKFFMHRAVFSLEALNCPRIAALEQQTNPRDERGP